MVDLVSIRHKEVPMSTIAEPSLLWEREAVSLHDQLAARGVVDPDTGERFTVRRIDDAIQLAVETVNGREGWRIADIFGPTWRALSDDVARALGIVVDELDGVEP
jgi:hypothetical protein